MKKSKIAALVVAGIMVVSVVGGTLAWFTSEDSLTNKFSSASVENPEEANGNGVEVYEDFVSPDNVVPGDETTKLVQVQNTTSYDSFIRVKITPAWTSASEGVELSSLSTDMLLLDFGTNVGTADGQWLKGDDNYYYFLGKVGAGTFTNALLKSVTLKTEAGNDYRGATYEVKVEAESIQADNDAHNAAWTTCSEATAKFDGYEAGTATNIEQLDSVTITSTTER